MKKTQIFLITLLLSTISLYSQDLIIGQWNGQLKIQGTQLRLVFNISKVGNEYVSTMDSPDQGAKGIKTSSTKFENSKLTITMTTPPIVYEGTLGKDNIIQGTFSQSGMSFPMNLSKEEIKKEILNRPQEPKKPYPYYSEDVTFENKKENFTLAGTLTMPSKEGSFPVVVMITGSGPENRDEEIMGHKPFLVISDYLTRNGIAVLRFDDRGVAQSKGKFSTATSEDFAEDVNAAVQYLMGRKEINKKHIGLMGHSEGGAIAPMVAVNNSNVSFIVLLAGPGISGGDILLLQKELLERVAGVSELEIQMGLKTNRGAFEIIKNNSDPEKTKEKLKAYITQVILDDNSPDKSSVTNDQKYEMLYNQISSPWMMYFIKHDPAPVLEKVKCPVLAINGSKDLQVPPKENLSAIKGALEKGGNKDATIKEIPNLNHLFQECKTGSTDEYRNIEQTFSPTALDIVTKWILERVK